MSRMFNLIEVLAESNKGSKEQAHSYISQLNMFRFDVNSIMNTLGQLMSGAADDVGEFKPNEVAFRDIGALFSILTELTSLCEDQERFYRRSLEDNNNSAQGGDL